MDSITSVAAPRWLLACGLCLAAAGPCLAADPFSIVLLPDTQHYCDSATNITHFQNQTQWIVDNRDSQNIAFVSHLGDIVEHGVNTTEWARADGAMDTLDTLPDLPYATAMGNHDFDEGINLLNGTALNYTNNFGAARYAGRSWFGTAAPDDRSAYQVFDAGGRTFLHMNLEWKALATSNANDSQIISWAQGVLDANPSTPTIITHHEYLNTGGRSSAGQVVFDTLVKDNPQVFMVFGGHVLGENHQTSQNAAGLDVYEVLANYQGRSSGGTGWLQMLEFDEDAGMINATTYSPSLDQHETDADSQYSFAMDFDARLTEFEPNPDPAPDPDPDPDPNPVPDVHIPNLVAYYPLEGGSGLIAADRAGENDGTLNGNASWASGKLGGGLEFTRTGDTTSFTSPTAAGWVEADGLVGNDILNDTDSYTFSAWAKFAPAAGGSVPWGYAIWGANTAPGDNGNVMRIGANKTADGVFTRTDHAFGADTVAWTDDAWHLFTITFGPAGNADYYIDGVLVVSKSDDPGLDREKAWSLATLFHFGMEMEANVATDGWSGLLDELAIWNRELTAQEISDLYNNGDGVSLLAGPSTDANGDGVVDAADYIALKTHMGQTAGAALADGDFDGDGDVDFGDLQLLLDSFGGGTETGAATIPEPASLGLLVMGSLAMLRRYRRH